MTHTSRLASARSAYLRSAAHQPVDWYLWGPEAFARARELNRPILLDIGAVWCHWCHVIDRESYENEGTARLINELYVPIKVDRDERPDVDSRYQQGVMALTGQGGWPLTGFLTPEGDLFWGGTYFPPEDRYGRPGFPRILREVAEFYDKNSEDAVRQGRQIRESLRGSLGAHPSARLTDALVDAAVSTLNEEYDRLHGGFGDHPKFPHPSAIDLLIHQYDATGDPDALFVARHTLEAMSRGGIHDQLGGGFHRYSVDAQWIVPHFEKMLYDNAGLLRNYSWAASVTGKETFRATATSIVEWADGVLSDRERGGFYSSQDADIGLDDDGDYWTWTIEGVESVLSESEFEVAARYFSIDCDGDMREHPGKNVLRRSQDAEEIASELDLPIEDVESLIDSSVKKLLSSRNSRRQPFIDTTIYVNWNGMMIQAYFDAARLLGIDSCRRFALTTLDRLLDEGVDSDGSMLHVLGGAEVPHTVDDQVQIALACFDAYQVTGDNRYLEKARLLGDFMIENYWDHEEHGFLDVLPGSSVIPFLSSTMKPIQDTPTASSNGCAIQLFELLGRVTGNDRYSRIADQTAHAFSRLAANLGLYGGAYFIGVDRIINSPPLAIVVGRRQSPRVQELRDVLLGTPRCGAAVMLHDPQSDDVETLPDVLTGVVDSHDSNDSPLVYLCAGSTCSRPIANPHEARAMLMELGKRQ